MFQTLTTFVIGWSRGYCSKLRWVLDSSATEYPYSLLWNSTSPLDLIRYQWPPMTYPYRENKFESQDPNTIMATWDHSEAIVSRELFLAADGFPKNLMNSFLQA